MINISIILPVHNEINNLENLIKDWNEELCKLENIKFEFIIVEDD